MTRLFFGETREVCPHSAPCTPTHPQIVLKPKRASVILQVPQFILAQREAPHVLSRGDRASGQAVGRAGSSPGEAKEEVGWLPRASQRAPASPSSRGGPQPIAAVYSAAHQAVAGADWRYLQRGVFYL